MKEKKTMSKICSKCGVEKKIKGNFRKTSTVIRGITYSYYRAECNECHNKKIYSTKSYKKSQTVYSVE